MKLFSAIAAITLTITPAQASMGTKAPNLLTEKLYYAEGRQHKERSPHGLFPDNVMVRMTEIIKPRVKTQSAQGYQSGGIN